LALNSELCEGHLEQFDWSVACYHAGLGQSERARVQRQWQENAIVAVVATIAFGMGIDKSDIRWVMHYMPSSSLEAFSQVRPFRINLVVKTAFDLNCLMMCARPHFEQRFFAA
jgi:ATP-dependent helicase YprA (DUF1998 family)